MVKNHGDRLLARRIAVFTGTRAEYGLLAPLMSELKSDPLFFLHLIVGGMHLSPEFGETWKDIVEDGFVIDDRVEMLLSSDTAAGVLKAMGLCSIAFADIFSRQRPDAIVLLGDRFEVLAAAQAALVFKIPIVHIHGGEITEGAIDDSIRHAVTKMANVHFPSTERYRQNIIQMGEDPDKVFNVGALGIDALQRSKSMCVEELSASVGVELTRNFFLMTYHPATAADENALEVARNIIDALNLFPEYKILITYPNADEAGRSILPLLKSFAKSNPGRVALVKSLGPIRYKAALQNATAMIGNSSSGILEAPAVGLPTINIGARQKGRLSASSVIHCGTSRGDIQAAILRAINAGDKPSNITDNPYGHGGAAEKILEILRRIPLSIEKKFWQQRA